MKTTIMVVVGALVVAFALFGVAEAAKKLQKGEEFAQVGIGSEAITVSRVVDGMVTCYIAQHGKYGSQDISCVK